jgi:glucose-6-phosphate isomerase
MDLGIKAVRLDFDEKTYKLYADGIEVPSRVRKLEEMRDVLLNQNFLNSKNKDDILYYMFRAAGEEKNRAAFQTNNLLHEVTVMNNYDLGGEFNKTFGHYHPICKNNLSYPEIYEVIYGEVLYIMQKKCDDGHYDVKLVHAKAGDKVIMEPNYGHISVNIGKTLLIELDMRVNFEADYQSIKDVHGGAVYVTDKKNVIINQNYKNVSITHTNAKKIRFLDAKKRLYDEFIAHPERFDFLNDPELLLRRHDEQGLAS